jgi:hypothetical protein
MPQHECIKQLVNFLSIQEIVQLIYITFLLFENVNIFHSIETNK